MKKFSLIELIAVITIMSVLLTMTISIKKSSRPANVTGVNAALTEVIRIAYDLPPEDYITVTLSAQGQKCKLKAVGSTGRVYKNELLDGELEFVHPNGHKYYRESVDFLGNGLARPVNSVSFRYTIDGNKASINVLSGKLTYRW